MPTSTRAGVYLRFHDTLRQNCRCPTGGQGRPPLQNVVRFRRRCVQFCDSPCRVDAHIDPYKCFTSSHWCIRFCRCVLPGGQSRPPLQGAMQKQCREGQAPPGCCGELRDLRQIHNFVGNSLCQIAIMRHRQDRHVSFFRLREDGVPDLRLRDDVQHGADLVAN